MLEHAWNRLRDRFSSSVLGTTSPGVPGLGGGLSRPARLAATAISLGLGLTVALLVGPPPAQRLRYVNCPFAPFLDTSDQNVCQGK